jgi:hypothetical protein
VELVDQVEPQERPPEPDAAPDHDVAVVVMDLEMASWAVQVRPDVYEVCTG